MSAVDHEAAVAKLLADLGDTADAVADRLRALGIKGKQAWACACPVANYLVRNGYEGAVFSAEEYAIPNPDDVWNVLTGRTPQPVGLFIDRFDEGVYLDLVEVAG